MGVETITWKPEQGQQTARLRAAGLSVADLKAAGFRWGRSQSWASEPTPEALAIVQKLADDCGSFRQPAPPEEQPQRAPAVSNLAARQERARGMAERMDVEASRGEGDRLTNTPKRLAQAMHARMEAARTSRGAALLRRWADDPARLPDWKPNKADVLEAVRLKTEGVSNGYHSYLVETTELADTGTPAALALRQAYGGCKVEETQDAKIARLEAEIRFAPIPGFFPTPPPLIRRLMELAGIQAGDSVLEPSAGAGHLAEAAREAGGHVVCCEVNGSLRAILAARGLEIVENDCLNLCGGPTYDVIVMNPPFEDGQDREHIRHLFALLRPGGRLVAVCGSGAFYRQNKADAAFRDWLDEVGAEVEEVEPGSFSVRDSFRQTGVSAKVITIQQAAQPCAYAERAQERKQGGP